MKYEKPYHPSRFHKRSKNDEVRRFKKSHMKEDELYSILLENIKVNQEKFIKDHLKPEFVVVKPTFFERCYDTQWIVEEISFKYGVRHGPVENCFRRLNREGFLSQGRNFNPRYEYRSSWTPTKYMIIMPEIPNDPKYYSSLNEKYEAEK